MIRYRVRRRGRPPTATPPAHWWTALEGVFRWMNDQDIPTLEQVEVPVAAINSDRVPVRVEVYQKHVPSFTLRPKEGLSHLGVLWQEVDVFDRYRTELVLAMTDG